MVEKFNIKEKGYHPFIIKKGWQLAKLNYIKEQHINNIKQLDVHLETDEIFILTAGKAVLIAASIIDDKPHFEVEKLLMNKIYNIPKGLWHNIAMEEGCEIFIAEKANTHISDFEHYALSKAQQLELNDLVSTQLSQMVENDK